VPEETSSVTVLQPQQLDNIFRR